jgi:hypothetical protein
VPPREGAYRRSPKTGLGQPLTERVNRWTRSEISVRPLRLQVGADSAMIDYPAYAPKLSAKERGPAREARRIGGVDMRHPCPVPGQGVDVGTRVAVVAVTGEMVWSEGVDIDIKNAHAVIGLTQS